MGLVLLGCASLRRPDGPIPQKLIPAPRPGASPVLVVVLPGRGDDLDDLAKTGMAETIQKAWPEADVLLAGATLPYYAEGHVQQRLHDEVILPARTRGYRQIWLTGASMGGMGTLLYERAYPRDVTGIVLYAPYMGDPATLAQITAAGGPAHWDPGPKPAALTADNYQLEMWRVVKSWQDPTEAQRVWLVCGDTDRLLEAAKLMAPLLPPEHFIEVKGGHDWPMWDAGAAQVIPQIAVMQH
ncbi:MAG TPA: alpha/beta hydrolase-fold protein [Gammaproteobacteria bacterium]|jgi:pimeloyl-ACP methyl ester carboxylesterase|nr:alpha/beta hydrolase-fold protein [Gammaproteobacteria bacterium]